nr:hypothetical protein [Tanacetum cinerariifolium]
MLRCHLFDPRRMVHALETICFSLCDQVSGYELLKDRIEEFQDAQMKIVDDKVAKLDADLLEMACHLEEKFYPHLLTTISGRIWLLTHDLKLILVKCLNSFEYLTTLRAAISRAIEQGMQSGLAVGIDHGKEGRSLTDVADYNPNAEVNFNSTLQKLCKVDFLWLTELKSHKDVSVEDIMNLLRLEGPLADAPGAASTSGNVLASVATTMALSTTFASASFIPPITVDDYEDQSKTDHEYYMNTSILKVPIPQPKTD